MKQSYSGKNLIGWTLSSMIISLAVMQYQSILLPCNHFISYVATLIVHDDDVDISILLAPMFLF